MNFESDLEKVNSKTPFCPPKGTKWGQMGPNPIFCPIIAIFTGKGPFWKFWTVVKSDFRNFDFWTPFGPPFSGQVGPIGAKSYFLPDHCHIRRKGTFLKVLNSGEVRFSKIWFLDPIWPPQGRPMGAKWGQIQFFAWSLPFSQGWDLFGNFEQWWSQIFENLTFRPHLAPLQWPGGANWVKLDHFGVALRKNYGS